MPDAFDRYQKKGLGYTKPEPAPSPENSEFQEELSSLLNKHSQENASGTPDFILADYLVGCLAVFNKTIGARAQYRGERIDSLFNNKYPNKVPVLVYARGQANEIGQAEIEAYPSETTKRGVIKGLIPIFGSLEVPIGKLGPEITDGNA
jgi:hypothetical protein